MKPFAALLSSLWAAFAVLYIFVILIGRMHPALSPLQQTGFGSCKGAMCFMGVTPGINWEQAKGILGTRAMIEPGDLKMLNVFIDPRNAVALYPSMESGKVGRIAYSYFPYMASGLSAAAVIEQYGVPCGVSVYYDNQIVTLHYPLMFANVSIRGSAQLKLASPVYQLQLNDPAFHSDIQPDPCIDNVTGWKMVNAPWRGFASVRFYIGHRN